MYNMYNVQMVGLRLTLDKFKPRTVFETFGDIRSECRRSLENLAVILHNIYILLCTYTGSDSK